MQHTVKGKAMGHETTFIVVVTGAVSHFPVLGGLQASTDARRMRHLILEQVAGHAGTAEAIAVIKPEGPLEHFVLAHLRRQAAIKFATPVKALREIVAPVSKFRHLHLVRFFSKLVINAVTGIDGE